MKWTFHYDGDGSGGGVHGGSGGLLWNVMEYNLILLERIMIFIPRVLRIIGTIFK
jgi:hypothetical protein